MDNDGITAGLTLAAMRPLGVPRVFPGRSGTTNTPPQLYSHHGGCQHGSGAFCTLASVQSQGSASSICARVNGFSSPSGAWCATGRRLRRHGARSSRARAGCVLDPVVGYAPRLPDLHDRLHCVRPSLHVRTDGDPARTQIDIERALGDVELRRNLAHTELALAVQGLGGQGGGFRLRREPARASAETATGPRCHEPRLRPLPDEVALELLQRPKQVKDQLAATGRGIKVFLETLEANAPLRQVGDDLDEMAERASEAVELSDHEDVALAQVGQHGLQDGALDACPTDDLLIHLPAASLPEGIELENETLLRRAHAGVPDLHRVLPESGILVVFTSGNSNQFFKHRGCQAAHRKSSQKRSLQAPQHMGRKNGR